MKAISTLAVLLFALGLPLGLTATPYDHIHLAAPDTEQAARWYAKHFGGRPSRFRDSNDTDLPIDRTMFGKISLVFFAREAGPGSVGSGVDHIGFSMTNVEQAIAGIVADGGKSLGELREFNNMTLGFVEDPWGTKIELIDDADLRGIHHLHLSSPDPVATLQWYQNIFGGETAQFGGALSGLHYGDIWLLVAQARAEVAPTQGRSLDHISWNFADLDTAAISMKAKGAVFSMEPRDYRGIKISFVDGPDGVRIEVVQP